MMARNRRTRSQSENPKTDKSTNSSSSNESNAITDRRNKKINILAYWKQIIGFIVFGIAVCFGYMGYLETRVNTPFDDQKLVAKAAFLDDYKFRYWGSYRPGTYFGFKTRDPFSLVTGLMWFFPERPITVGQGIRHWCEQSDNLDKYGWQMHDGANFGIQEIIDQEFVLNTNFYNRIEGNHGGDWTARISVDFKPEYKKKPNAKKTEEVSLIWYVALDEEGSDGSLSISESKTKITGIKGETPGLGKFSISFDMLNGTLAYHSYLYTIASGFDKLTDQIYRSLEVRTQPREMFKLRGYHLPTDIEGRQFPANFAAVQVTGQVPFELEVLFESGSNNYRETRLNGNDFHYLFYKMKERFAEQFEDIFKLNEHGYNESFINFAHAALSNTVGSIGYFYGTSLVQSAYTKKPVHYWRAPLYTAVPSRSFFPRGFLWDEGFHGLLISAWNIDIEFDIIVHWFDLMNVEGWIPREQILGVEALAKVPEEFVVQHNTNANPPTFFITLQYILNNHIDKLDDGKLMLLESLYPRLQAWFAWFNTTQKGSLPGTYRWRGRDGKTNRELNPKTLTSGLDDYPRASHPTDDEYHLDLYCWIAMAADTMARLAILLDRDDYHYEETASYLRDNELLDKMHWSEKTQSYADYGLHTDAVQLKRPKALPRSSKHNMEMVRVVLKRPQMRFIDKSFGYVSLFPLLLQMIDVDSPKLEKVLDDLRNPKLLWTNYGLRSLAKTAPLYKKHNTEHDPPYWRGAIWININFLATRALHYYGTNEGPYREKAYEIYQELRKNVVDNVMRQYYKTGYLWEQYNDETGEGSGCRPFNGWTALVVMMMGELY